MSFPVFLCRILQSYDGLEYFFPVPSSYLTMKSKTLCFNNPTQCRCLKKTTWMVLGYYVFVPPPYSLLPFPSALLDTREKTREGLTLETTYSFVAELKKVPLYMWWQKKEWRITIWSNPTSLLTTTPLALEHLCSTHLHASIYLVIIKYYPTSLQDLSYISFFFLSIFYFEKWQFLRIFWYCEKANVTSKIWFSKFYPIFIFKK